MTNEEAINELRDASDNEVRYGDTDNHYDEVMKRVEAFDVAIKVLEQKPCEDCISRQAAINSLGECPMVWTDSDAEITAERDWKDTVKMLKRLPSVTPHPKIGHWINLEKTKYKGQVLPFWCRYECSKCGGHGEETFNYCPNCGAKMGESEDKE